MAAAAVMGMRQSLETAIRYIVLATYGQNQAEKQGSKKLSRFWHVSTGSVTGLSVRRRKCCSGPSVMT